MTTVHPHACGEHSSNGCCLACSIGSSPRMWGTRNANGGFTVWGRFIPTHVGNTHIPDLAMGNTSVHPHACGEHANGAYPVRNIAGSSPRMWGTREQPRIGNNSFRFIPTHVGNTRHGLYYYFHASVHPHACGEHYSYSGSQNVPAGSSPRMWGTRLLFRRHC